MQVDHREFYEAIRDLAYVAKTNKDLPILSYIFLVAENDTLTMVATDLDQWMIKTLPAEGDLNVCIHAKTLLKLIKPKAKQLIDQLSITNPQFNNTEITSSTFTTTLLGICPEDFPTVPTEMFSKETETIATYKADELKDLLKYILPAVSSDSSRETLNSVCLDYTHMTCTDGHRLLQIFNESNSLSSDQSLVIPSGIMITLKKVLPKNGEVTLNQYGENINFTWGENESSMLVSKLIDSKYPDFRRLISDLSPVSTSISVDTKTLIDVLKQAKDLFHDCIARFKIVSSDVSLIVDNPDSSDFTITVPTISNTHRGDILEVAFNIKYMLDAICLKEEVVKIGLSGPMNAIRIEYNSPKFGLVMPTRM